MRAKSVKTPGFGRWPIFAEISENTRCGWTRELRVANRLNLGSEHIEFGWAPKLRKATTVSCSPGWIRSDGRGRAFPKDSEGVGERGTPLAPESGAEASENGVLVSRGCIG